MMSNRGLGILLAVAAALVLLATFAQRRGDSTTSSQGMELVPGLEDALNDVERITLVRAGGEIIATLERGSDTWVVAQKNGYRADVGKIRESLRALAESRILEQKTANPELYDRLGVEDVESDDATGIAITLSAGSRELPTLILGDAEGTKYRYARRAGEPQSYLIDRDPDLPRNASQWVDPTILDVRAERVQQVTITHPDGEVVAISKADADAGNFDVANVPADRALLYPGVANTIGNALRELNLEDVEPVANADDDEQASAQPSSEEVLVEFRTFDGLIVHARGSEQSGVAWVRFEASVNPEQAAQFAAAAGGDDDPENEPADGSPDAEDEPGDAAAEAERINRRVAGWRYQIAGYQYDQMTRRMNDLLKPPG